MAASRLAAMPLSHLKRAVVPSARAPNALLSSLKSVAPQRTHGVLHVRLSFASWPVPPVTSARSSSVQIRALCSINPSSPTRASVGATLPAADAIRDIVASGNEGHGSGGSGSGSGWGRGGQGDRSGESRRTETAVAAFGAMLVISVHHTLQHTCSAQCQAKPPAPVKREVSTVAGALPEPEPVTLYEMFAILEGEWMWLAGLKIDDLVLP
ncbi:hypothetical protein T484DRAFT_1847597 [Baffinella frigidus]|nr:hypothetical protein T484DRAFT_1847597 [Cryptophyta sp. CCMP2293]